MQGWLNSEVGDLIKTVRSYRRETQSPKPLPQLPAPPCLESNPNITKDNTKELKEISAKLTSLATEIHYLQKDRNSTLNRTTRDSYKVDAVSYVQVKRDGKLCTVKCKICPEHKVHAKLYRCSLMLDEEEENILSVRCEHCVASQWRYKHAILAYNIHITAKELSKGNPVFPGNSSALKKFLQKAKKRKITDCELLKYQHTHCVSEVEAVSVHQLACNHKEKHSVIQKVEELTREQSKSALWFELRYGRITTSRAFEVSRCKTRDGTLIALILGGKIPDTQSMKRGRTLEDYVRKTVIEILRKPINKCGLLLSSTYPMIAGSTDGIFEDGIIEIKCPLSEKTYKNYVKNGEPTEKYNAQMKNKQNNKLYLLILMFHLLFLFYPDK
ncbi:hypothetical protein ABMA27_003408 [Loxostege sticticalis]|uniref:YqaJ viral recombinase domain-containing protein n=1 Tax=Loxostege sticticalis TaxID=481309 RepID=A0ABR3HT73_LOXSC